MVVFCKFICASFITADEALMVYPAASAVCLAASTSALAVLAVVSAFSNSVFDSGLRSDELVSKKILLSVMLEPSFIGLSKIFN